MELRLARLRTYDILSALAPEYKHNGCDWYDTLKASAMLSVLENKVIVPSTANEAQEFIHENVYKHRERGREISYTSAYYAPELHDFVQNQYVEETTTSLLFHPKDIPMFTCEEKDIWADVIQTRLSENHLKQIADPKFKRQDFLFILKEADVVIGEMLVPHTQKNRKNICRINKYGIFSGVDYGIRYDDNNMQALFFNDFKKDSITGNYIFSVVRGYIVADDYASRFSICINGREYSTTKMCFRPTIHESFDKKTKPSKEMLKLVEPFEILEETARRRVAGYSGYQGNTLNLDHTDDPGSF